MSEMLVNSSMKITRMPVSAEAVWPELGQVGSTVARLFAFLVVPLSLLPPMMIYWAGSHQGVTTIFLSWTVNR